MSKTRLTGITVATAAVAAALTSGYIAYFSGDVKVSGDVVAGDSLSGALLKVAPTSGTGTLQVRGSGGGTGSGGALCYQDTDQAGFTICHALNGTVSCRTAQADECL